MFPSILMVELNNTVPNEVEEVAGAVCIAKFGYRIFAYMDAVQKEKLCEYFERQGITILPHHTSTVFCTGSPLVGLHQLARGLEELRIRFVTLVGYGIKTPYSDMQLLCHISESLEGGLNRYDVGRNMSLPFIPLFNFDSRMSGETFPMLTKLGEGNGSVQSALMRAGPQSTVTLKVYPHLIHKGKKN